MENARAGQGSLEYLLLIGGAVLIAVVAIVAYVQFGQTWGNQVNSEWEWMKGRLGMAKYQGHCTDGDGCNAGEDCLCNDCKCQAGEMCAETATGYDCVLQADCSGMGGDCCELSKCGSILSLGAAGCAQGEVCCKAGECDTTQTCQEAGGFCCDTTENICTETLAGSCPSGVCCESEEKCMPLGGGEMKDYFSAEWGEMRLQDMGAYQQIRGHSDLRIQMENTGRSDSIALSQLRVSRPSDDSSTPIVLNISDSRNCAAPPCNYGASGNTFNLQNYEIPAGGSASFYITYNNGDNPDTFEFTFSFSDGSTVSHPEEVERYYKGNCQDMGGFNCCAPGTQECEGSDRSDEYYCGTGFCCAGDCVDIEMADDFGVDWEDFCMEDATVSRQKLKSMSNDTGVLMENTGDADITLTKLRVERNSDDSLNLCQVYIYDDRDCPELGKGDRAENCIYNSSCNVKEFAIKNYVIPSGETSRFVVYYQEGETPDTFPFEFTFSDGSMYSHNELIDECP